MISIVVPAFNEEAAIEDTVNSLVDICTAADFQGFEIIVVDDGSSDQTAELARQAGAQVIGKPQNIGYGHSLKMGIEKARHDTIVITDADGTYPIDKIPELLEIYSQGFDMVVGRRTGKYYRESIIKFPLRLVFKWLVEFTVGSSVPDVNSGLRIFSRAEIMKLFPSLSNTFSFTTSSTLAYSMRNKYVKYVPIPYFKRIGKTKVRLVRDSMRALQYLVQAIVFYNPIKIFLVLSGLTLLISVGLLFCYALFSSMVFGLVGGIGAIAAIIIFVLGLLAEQIRTISINLSENKDKSEP
jgi:polyisoprenyl-phosphate glycosyltransferase